MKKLLVIFALFAAVATQAQEVEKATFLFSVKETDSLYVDRYRVQGETLAPQPCLIFVFGGGFMSGNRDQDFYIPFFEYMAQQGFTVASIDYRLGLKKAIEANQLNEKTFPAVWIGTIAMAVEDLYDATNYLLANAEAWNIDPKLLLTSGSSAGAITVLHGEYYLCNGGILSRKLPADFNYAGVISFAGAIFDMGDELNWGTGRKPAPMLLFHGDADRNVPYKAVRAQGAGFFGSKYISDQLTAMRVPHAFYSVANTDHVMAGSPMNDNRYDIDNFIQKLVLKQLPLIIRTDVTPLDKAEIDKNFKLEDFINANLR